MELWVNEYDLKVYQYWPLRPPEERFLWRRVPVPYELVKQIIECSPNPYLPLVYWADQWDSELEEI